MQLLACNVLGRDWYFMSQPPKNGLLVINLHFHFGKAVLPSTYYCKEEIKIMNSEPSRKGKDKVVRI